MSESLHPSFETWFRQHLPDVPFDGARAALALFAEGATVPFVARYRRERTSGLDEDALRRTSEARDHFERILSRQAIIAESIERHAGISDELRARILSTFDPDALEDLYHPYRQQKKNRALAAREAGLGPLADWIWDTGHGTEAPQEGQTLELWAFTFRNEEKGVADAKAAIEGARDILVERLASDPDLRALVRRTYVEQGVVRAARTEKAKAGSKFEAYFAFEEPVSSLREPAASHRYLALRRGQSEGELQLAVAGRADDPEFEGRLVAAFEARACTAPDAPGAEVLRHAGRIAFKNDVRTSVENEIHRVLKDAADAAAAQAFAGNVRRLLLEPPFGAKPVLGIDPGTKAGCRLAVVDGAGALAATEVVHLQTDEQKSAAGEALVRLARDNGVLAVAVGNGAGGRETEVIVRKALREAGIDAPVVLVSEAGSSAWSTSEAARAEFPELEPTLRGAVSIARRLQEPLAELVKFEPRALGAGQYPHDVAHAALQRALDAVVESCVSRVGVDVNAAGPALLARVAGLTAAHAAAIVERRAKQGPFRSRRQLLEVPRVTEKVFEQAAGFLRVRGGEHPFDATGVHPERYAVLEAFAAGVGKGPGELLGAGAALVRDAPLLAGELGPRTLEDVAAELERAGADPRGQFSPFSFREDVQKLEDVKSGMVCPGIVTNVTAFGAFVDIGAHHDGLVHVSQLGRSFAKEPREVVHAGERVEVRVLKVDLEKKQISLTMRRPAEGRPAPKPTRRPDRRPAERKPAPAAARPDAPSRPLRPDRPRRPGPPGERPRPGGERPSPRRDAPTERSAAERPAPERAARPARRPAIPPADNRPDSRRPAFNNPFAVLAGLKVPPRK